MLNLKGGAVWYQQLFQIIYFATIHNGVIHYQSTDAGLIQISEVGPFYIQQPSNVSYYVLKPPGGMTLPHLLWTKGICRWWNHCVIPLCCLPCTKYMYTCTPNISPKRTALCLISLLILKWKPSHQVKEGHLLELRKNQICCDCCRAITLVFYEIKSFVIRSNFTMPSYTVTMIKHDSVGWNKNISLNTYIYGDHEDILRERK